MLEGVRKMHNRPDDDMLGSSLPEKAAEFSESAERNLREHLELRLRFANAVSRALDISFVDALREYTDIPVRITGQMPWQSRGEDPKWTAFAERIRSAESQEEIEEYIITLYKESVKERGETVKNLYWPFSYDYHEEDMSIHLHFGSMGVEPDQAEGDPGTLSSERYEEQRAKLAAMFAEIQAKYPNVKEVKGGSWLYNREAYRRLYPRE